jgi:GNAT superfamily N-acetyltransferase
MEGAMMFADLELAKRLERAEGFACVQFAAARKKVFPEGNSEWMRCAGADVVFDGVDAPTTQTFGLGLFEELTPDDALEEIERFFSERGAAVMHEVSPLVGVTTLELLCRRGYRPIEISNVLFRTVESPASIGRDDIRVRVIGADEAEVWAAVSARGWTHEHPELKEFVEQMGVLMVAREQSPCFLAEMNGVAVPEMRRRGLQGALLEARMRYAHQQGCDLAMMVAEAGSESQRNAERQGFRVAYTRMKWKLMG